MPACAKWAEVAYCEVFNWMAAGGACYEGFLSGLLRNPFEGPGKLRISCRVFFGRCDHADVESSRAVYRDRSDAHGNDFGSRMIALNLPEHFDNDFSPSIRNWVGNLSYEQVFAIRFDVLVQQFVRAAVNRFVRIHASFPFKSACKKSVTASCLLKSLTSR